MDLGRHTTTTMKIPDHKEEYLRSMVREIIGLDPLITVRGMQRTLQGNTKHTIGDKYVMRLMHKVRREAVVRSDRTKVTERIAEIRLRFEAMQKQLTRIAYWNPLFITRYGIHKPKQSDQIRAMESIAKMDIALFRAEMDTGVFEDKRLALEEMLREGMLPYEIREQIVGIFRTYKLGAIKTV